MVPFLITLALGQVQAADVEYAALPDGFVRITSKVYSVEVPKAWTVGSQTPWGARTLAPARVNRRSLE